MTHYYIDGYNLMFRLLHTDDDLQTERQHIIQDINSKIQNLGIRITLVFDAQYQTGSATRTHFQHLQILFSSHGETADDLIIQCLKEEDNPRQCTVVTSDKQLAWRARHLEAKTQSVGAFMKWLNKAAQKRTKPTAPPTPPPQRSKERTTKIITDGSFEHYLETFEKHLKEDMKKKPQKPPPIPDYDRWLKLFEEKEKGDGA